MADKQREWCHIDRVEIDDLLERWESNETAPNENGRKAVQYDLKKGTYVIRQERGIGELSYWMLDTDDINIVLGVEPEDLPPSLLTRVYPCREKRPTFFSKREFNRGDHQQWAIDESLCSQT